MIHCERVVADGKYQDFGQVLQKLIEVIGIANDCADRHDASIDYELKKAKK